MKRLARLAVHLAPHAQARQFAQAALRVTGWMKRLQNAWHLIATHLVPHVSHSQTAQAIKLAQAALMVTG